MILTSEVRGQIVGDKGSYSTLMLLHYGLVFRYRFTFSRTASASRRRCTKSTLPYHELRKDTRALVERSGCKVHGSPQFTKVYRHYVHRFCETIQAGLKEKIGSSIDPVASRKLEADLGEVGANRGIMPDFSNVEALRGYALRHFGRTRLMSDLVTQSEPDWLSDRISDFFQGNRVGNSCEPSSHRCINVASLGGGPGFDFLCFSALSNFVGGPIVSTTVHEYESSWKDIVASVEQVVQDVCNSSRYECGFDSCDITVALNAATNERIAFSVGSTEIYTCSYVIAENAAKLSKGDFIFFRDLFSEAPQGTLFFFTETTHRLWPDIIDMARSASMRVAIPHLRSGKVGWQLALLKDARYCVGDNVGDVVMSGVNKELYERFKRDNRAHLARLDRGWKRERPKRRGAKERN